MKKRLYRSDTNKVVAGIIGGFGEYLDIDPVLLRVLYVALTVFGAVVPGIIVYIIALFIVPRRPRGAEREVEHTLKEE